MREATGKPNARTSRPLPNAIPPLQAARPGENRPCVGFGSNLRTHRAWTPRCSPVLRTVGHIACSDLLMSLVRPDVLVAIPPSLIPLAVPFSDPQETGGHYGATVAGDPTDKALRDAKLLGARVAERVLKLR